MLEELQTNEKVVGIKQSRKALRDGKALKVYLARDADPAITVPLADVCAEQNIPVDTERDMTQLGRACGIAVGAAAVTLLRSAKA